MQKGRSEASTGVGRKKCWWWWEGSGGSGGKQGPEEPTNMKPALQVGHCVLLCVYTVYRNIQLVPSTTLLYNIYTLQYILCHKVPKTHFFHQIYDLTPRRHIKLTPRSWTERQRDP